MQYVIFWKGQVWTVNYFDVRESYSPGMVVYDTHIKKYYVGSAWIDVRYL